MLRFAIVFSVMATSGCGRTGFDATDNNLGGVDSGADPDASSADAASGPCGAELAIGTQCWLAHNLDVGTQIPGAVAPVANTVVEKTCYDDLASNCVSGGGLYEWDEAMAGSTTERAQGICPGGWHIPSDGDWKVLEQFLGMDVATVELYDFRGVQAPALRVGGSTAFDAPLAGIRPDTGGWFGISTSTFFWSSTQVLSGANGISRRLETGFDGIQRYGYDKNNAFSVRCVKD